MQKFEKELQRLINRHSVEKKWDMPDFIMAKVIVEFIKSAGPAMKQNLDWHGVNNVCPRSLNTDPNVPTTES